MRRANIDQEASCRDKEERRRALYLASQSTSQSTAPHILRTREREREGKNHLVDTQMKKVSAPTIVESTQRAVVVRRIASLRYPSPITDAGLESRSSFLARDSRCLVFYFLSHTTHQRSRREAKLVEQEG